MAIFRLILQIFAFIPKENRRKGLAVFILLCLSSVFQVLGIVSVMPFLLALADTEMLLQNETLKQIFDMFGFETTKGFQIALGVLCFIMFLTSAGVRSFAFYKQNYYIQSQRFNLCSRIMRGYLAQPYVFFLDNKGSNLIKTVLGETDQFIDRALLPAAQIMNSALQLTVLVCLILFLNPSVAVVTMSILGGSYALVYRYARPQLLASGAARYHAESERAQLALEAVAGVKAMKLAGLELNFAQRFEEPSHIIDQSRAWSAFMTEIPRHAIEAIAFGGIVLLALILTIAEVASGGAPGTDVLPVLVVYAFAGYRMMPALQGLYSSLSHVRFMTTAIADLRGLIDQLEGAPALQKPVAPLGLKKTCQLNNLTYAYGAQTGAGVHDISLTIPAGTSLGIVGQSGAGKTTLVDTVLGLLEPTSGEIVVDGQPIDASNKRAWQRSLGYVPQDIYLADRSIAENIAFGQSGASIDIARVQHSAEIAQIHEFITNDLPDGYDTMVGDRGMRLSGGQRQRIGIARALYGAPDVVFFDEATSALDTMTEAAVMQSIAILQQTCTVVLIAHRLSTVQNCDQIAVLEGGKLVGLGDYDSLAAHNLAFQRLLKDTASTRSSRVK